MPYGVLIQTNGEKYLKSSNEDIKNHVVFKTSVYIYSYLVILLNNLMNYIQLYTYKFHLNKTFL